MPSVTGVYKNLQETVKNGSGNNLDIQNSQNKDNKEKKTSSNLDTQLFQTVIW